jgi:diphthine-ammonia ligase
MSESLNVIALISGGKDSFYSILHCLRNGHKVVALGNLHPSLPDPTTSPAKSGNEEEEDLNSWMYQTVGHTVIPLYEAALGIPLYRQAISGAAVSTGTTYTPPPVSGVDGDKDETESLVPLLQKIKKAHPEANAVSTGAILSTYQRTRVESVALRLGLTPLSFLWQYPILPPSEPASLLRDMQAVGLDARIIKVSGGGLDEGMLWENVASEQGRNRVEKAVKRFGTDGDGAVLGEGGEFETLVVDGPRSLFRMKIVVGQGEEQRRVVREGGGSAWLSIKKAELVVKDGVYGVETDVRVPGLLDESFLATLRCLQSTTADNNLQSEEPESFQRNLSRTTKWKSFMGKDAGSKWTVVPRELHQTVEHQVRDITEQLNSHNIDVSAVISTVILLNSMGDFVAINKVNLSSKSDIHKLTIQDIRRFLLQAQSTSKSNHCMRRYSTARLHCHYSSHILHSQLITTESSTPRTVKILLGASKHRAIFSSTLVSLSRKGILNIGGTYSGSDCISPCLDGASKFFGFLIAG